MLNYTKVLIVGLGLVQSLNFVWASDTEKLQVTLSDKRQLECVYAASESVNEWISNQAQSVQNSIYLCESPHFKSVLARKESSSISFWTIYALDESNSPISPQVIEVRKQDLLVFKTEALPGEPPSTVYEVYNRMDRLVSAELPRLLKLTGSETTRKIISEIKTQGKHRLIELEQAMTKVTVKTKNGKTLLCTRLDSKRLSPDIQPGSCGDQYDYESCHGCPSFSCESLGADGKEIGSVLWFGLKSGYGVLHPFHLPIVMQPDPSGGFNLNLAKKIQTERSDSVFDLNPKTLENDRKTYHLYVPTDHEVVDGDASRAFTLHYLQHNLQSFEQFQKECSSPEIQQTIGDLKTWFSKEKAALETIDTKVVLKRNNEIFVQSVVPQTLVPDNTYQVFGDVWGEEKITAEDKLWLPSSEKADMHYSDAIKLFSAIATSPDINWQYADMYCQNRALLAGEEFASRGFNFQKIWVIPDRPGGLSPRVLKGRSAWGYHVAITANVSKADGSIERLVFDPALADAPLPVDDWLELVGARKNAESLNTLWPPITFDLYKAKQQLIISPGNVYNTDEGMNSVEFEKNKAVYIKESKLLMESSRM